MLLLMSNLKRIHVTYEGAPGLPGTNTIYGHENGTSAAEQVDAVFAFFTSMGPSINSSMTVTVDPIVDIVDSTTGLTTGQDDTGAGGTVDCSSSTDPLPLATALLVQFRTGTFFGGRELRGRIFIAGMTEGNSTAGKPDASSLAVWQPFVDTLLDDGQLAVYSPTKHEWASMSSATIWTEWAVMRSRRD